MMVDSHYSTICRSEDLVSRVNQLSQTIKRDTTLVSLIDSQLRGPLMACVAPPSPSLNESQAPMEHEQGSKRWKKLLNEVQNGVGEYAVEALVIKI